MARRLGESVKVVLERVMEGADRHLGHDKHDAPGNGSGNSRNERGKPKTVLTGACGLAAIFREAGWVAYDPTNITKH